MKSRTIICAAAFLFSLVCSVQAGAQSAYTCDFEDDAENANWVMNRGLVGENLWWIGSAENNGGSRSLYVTADSGSTAGYVNTQTLVTAWRSLTLPSDTFELSFDWQAFGFDENDALYVCWVPESVLTNSNTNGIVAGWMTKYGVTFNDSTKLYGSTWQATYDTIVSDGTPHKLVFAWVNGNMASVPPGACVDNINIVPLSTCEKPYDIEMTATDSSVWVTWQGTADSYDIRATSSANPGVWVEAQNVTGNRYEVKGFGEGVMTAYVRSNCSGAHTVWISYSHFMFYPGTRCVDYMALADSNCWIGTNANPRQERRMVDMSYVSKNSRHTVHYDKTETDVRTNGVLKTVPDDEVASVRLGNWEVHSEGEAVEYDFTVDAETSGILLLKYAVVLQDPGHEVQDQPRFQLTVMDQSGQVVGKEGCADIDFIAGQNTTGSEWIEAAPIEGSADDPPFYKLWTTVGVNLQDYDGQTLKVRVSSHDCGEGMHYGYAYYTLGCTGAYLEGLSCGEDASNEFKAPDGFDYRWYNVHGEVSTGQVLTLEPTDTLTYWCDVMQKTDHNCYYTLEASAVPRFPHSEFNASRAQSRDCRNVMEFSNTSGVIRVNPITNDTTRSSEEYCDSVVWDFGDGTTSTSWSPVHEFPLDGGTFTVTLTSHLSTCTDVRTQEISLPALGTVRDTIRVVCCEENTPYEFNGLHYVSSGCFSDTLVSTLTGCDSIVTLDLTVPTDNWHEYGDTVCTDDLPYMFNGRECYSSDTYIDTLRSSYGCDSVVVCHLLVNTSLNIDFPTELTACADDGELVVPYTLTSGIVTSYSVRFGSEAAAPMEVERGEAADGQFTIPLSDSVRPATYDMSITFANAACGDVVRSATLRLDYPDSILVQRWNDVIGVRNALWNGGYDFSAFQWYADGQPIDGQTASNLYLPDGLNPDVHYSARLTRADDGVEAFTCPIRPVVYADIELVPTVTFAGGSISVKSGSAGSVRVWSVSGVLVSQTEIGEGMSRLAAPRTAGTYVVEIRLADGTRKIEKLIVKE